MGRYLILQLIAIILVNFTLGLGQNDKSSIPLESGRFQSLKENDISRLSIQCACNSRLRKPVCDVNGIQHQNACFARCLGAVKKCDGPCPCANIRPTPRPEPKPECNCGKIYIPKCGSDGNIYPNECEAKCADKGIECNGRLPCRTCS